MDIIQLIGIVLGIIVGLTVHEFAHAWTANKLGDPTARIEGRISLNPLNHLDPLGTLALLIFHFGWGKPVPYNPNNFSHPVFYSILVALAGPISNILLALILFLPFEYLHLYEYPNLAGSLLGIMIYLNLALAVFNLIPIPPLDGSKILLVIFSNGRFKVLYKFVNVLPTIFVILIAYQIAFNVNLFSFIIDPVIDMLLIFFKIIT